MIDCEHCCISAQSQKSGIGYAECLKFLIRNQLYRRFICLLIRLDKAQQRELKIVSSIQRRMIDEIAYLRKYMRSRNQIAESSQQLCQ